MYTARRPRKAQARKNLDSTSTHGDSPERAVGTSSLGHIFECDVDAGNNAEEHNIVMPGEMSDQDYESKYNNKHPGRGRLLMAQGKSRYIDGTKADQVGSPEALKILLQAFLDGCDQYCGN